MSSYYSREELLNIGFKSVGKEVYLSKKASIYGVENISIGSYVRIDDFAILSGFITIGSYVHIAAGSMLYGGKTGIELKDFSTISSRCAIYSETDDYYGGGLSLPLLDDEYRIVKKGKVILEKHVLIGTGCTILPDVVLGEGVSVGAMSFIRESLESWTLYSGIPAKKMSERKKDILRLEDEVRERYK